MESFREMSKEELQAQEVEVNKKYQEFKDLHLSLNMARGKPAPDQIDHANGMLETMDTGRNNCLRNSGGKAPKLQGDIRRNRR